MKAGSIWREHTYYCLQCRDEPAGWRMFACPGVGEDIRDYTMNDRAIPVSRVECGRRQEHHAHVYAHRCECFGTNKVVLEQQARQRVKLAETA